MRNRNRRCSLAAAVVLALAGLTACSGGATDEKSSGGSGVASMQSPPDAAKGVVGSSASDSSGANRAVVRTKSVIKTGEISITDKDLAKVRGEIDDLLSTVGGSVDNEDTTNDRKGRVDRSTLVLRVPVDAFDTAKTALSGLGTLKSSKEGEKDVTTAVIDTAERVQTLQNSLDRLQKYQRSATDVRALLRYEDQITARQGELQSLKAQQTYLSDQSTMATITLRMSTPEKYVAPPSALEDAGFLTGLKGGWHALVGFVIVALTVLGAVLPFLVAFTLVGVPLWLGLRTVLRRRRTPALPPVSP